MSRPLIAVALACAALSACGGSSRPAHTIHTSGPEMCSPLQSGDHTGGACVTPFPNAWFEETSTTTATKVQVVFPDGALPANTSGVPLKQSTLGLLDGYSPATPLIAFFENGVNAMQLTTQDNIADSLTATNPIALVDMSTKQRVPFFAEVDANQPGAGRHVLLIHPMVRLKYATRYAVAITNALKDGNGAALAPQGDFALWVNGNLPNTSPLAEIADRLDADADAFAKLGIPKNTLALAWDFDTASDALTTGYLQGMVSDALAADPKGSSYMITSHKTNGSGFIEVQGQFASPSFEAGPDPSPLNWVNNKPKMGDPDMFSFTAVIPPCALAGKTPVPLAIIGHGLFGTANEELQGDEDLLNQLCMVGIGADFLGVSQPDFLGIVAGKVLPDTNNFPLITDRLMQAHVNFQILTRLAINALAQDAVFTANGGPVYNTQQVYYWGASNGGIQGVTYLALSQDVNRALFNVPGAEWSLLIWRSAEFSMAGLFFNQSYPDPMDQQVLIAMSQSLWDRSDPIEFGTHIDSSKSALFQQSMDDPLVTNISTELEARTLGLQALAPLVEPVYGLTPMNGPIASGLVYTQWSIAPMSVPPKTDTPADASMNDAHNAIRALPDAIAQMKAWLQPNGKAVDTCPSSQPCIYPGE